MNRIIINEQDLTTPNAVQQVGTDIAYVPGFAVPTGSETIVGYGKPTLCTSSAEFKKNFGSKPAVFQTTQYYPGSGAGSAGTGFDQQAIPGYVSTGAGSTWIEAGQPDPSYIYALELLYAGIPVLYERLNKYATQSEISEVFEQGGANNTQYTTGVTYSFGDLVIYDSKVYTCVSAYAFEATSQTAPPVDDQSTTGGDESLGQNQWWKYVRAAGDSETSITLDSYINVRNFYDELSSRVLDPGATISLGSYTLYPASSSGKILYYLRSEDTSTVPATPILPVAGDAIQIQVSVDPAPKQYEYYYIREVNAAVDPMNVVLDRSLVVSPEAVESGYTVLLAGRHEPQTLADKNEYSFKYLTTGGYPSFEYGGISLASQMTRLCELRGDCVALIDHTDFAARPLQANNPRSVYYKLRQLNPDMTYGTMITPWYQTSLAGRYYTANNSAVTTAIMPGSFAFLKCLAKSIKTFPNWLAIAGVTRGFVPELISLHVNDVLTNAIADSYQDHNALNINAITNIKPYGYCIWGNRTLKNNVNIGGTTATSFLNIRNMLSDIKKQVYVAAISLMFEQNTVILWEKFKSLVSPLLNRLQSGQGISGYKIIKVPTPEDKTKLAAIIRIYPIYAIESFEITIQLTDDEVTVE